jgi:hypothetical protein
MDLRIMDLLPSNIVRGASPFCTIPLPQRDGALVVCSDARRWLEAALRCQPVSPADAAFRPTTVPEA